MENQETLNERYENTLVEYTNLFSEDPDPEIWPGVQNAFCRKRQKIIHVDALRLVGCYAIMHNNKHFFESPNPVINFIKLKQGILTELFYV